MDEELNWEHHINHVANKLAAANYALSQSKNIPPLHIKKTIYNSLSRPYLEYGVIACGGTNQKKIKRLEVLQKKCIRNIAGKKANSHTDPIFSSLKLLKFKDIHS